VGQCERGSASGAKEEGPRKGFSEPERLCEGQISGAGEGYLWCANETMGLWAAVDPKIRIRK
jgi:hypothetical protein